VVHTANLVGPHFTNNVGTTLEVARACGEAADSLDRLVYVSSSGVFPNDSHVLACAYHPVDELHPKRVTSEYNLSKLIGEQLMEVTSRQTGLRTVIVRPSHVLSGEKVLAQFTVQRVVGNLKSGQANKGSELYLADGTELWKQVEAAAEDASQPCIVTDMEGRPWYYQPNDARDVAHALVCALERPEALEPYRGEWVVVYKQQVLAHSPDGRAAAQAASARDYPGSTIFYVPTREEAEAVRIL
jgi:UDP-glucose 4-epimerase